MQTYLNKESFFKILISNFGIERMTRNESEDEYLFRISRKLKEINYDILMNMYTDLSPKYFNMFVRNLHDKILYYLKDRELLQFIETIKMNQEILYQFINSLPKNVIQHNKYDINFCLIQSVLEPIRLFTFLVKNDFKLTSCDDVHHIVNIINNNGISSKQPHNIDKNVVMFNFLVQEDFINLVENNKLLKNNKFHDTVVFIKNDFYNNKHSIKYRNLMTSKNIVCFKDVYDTAEHFKFNNYTKKQYKRISDCVNMWKTNNKFTFPLDMKKTYVSNIDDMCTNLNTPNGNLHIFSLSHKNTICIIAEIFSYSNSKELTISRIISSPHILINRKEYMRLSKRIVYSVAKHFADLYNTYYKLCIYPDNIDDAILFNQACGFQLTNDTYSEILCLSLQFNNIK